MFSIYKTVISQLTNDEIRQGERQNDREER
jgi:hypothetical protein